MALGGSVRWLDEHNFGANHRIHVKDSGELCVNAREIFYIVRLLTYLLTDFFVLFLELKIAESFKSQTTGAYVYLVRINDQCT